MDEKIQKSLRFENYQIILVKVDDEFQLCIPEILLFVNNENLQKAYVELEVKFNNLKNDYKGSQVLSAMPSPTMFERDKKENSIKIFAMKCIVAGGLLLSVGYFGAYIVTEKVSQVSVAYLIKQQIKGLQSFVVSWSNLNDNRKEEIVLETENQLKEIKPFIKLIQGALRN
jgi:hypothetical protein